MTQDGILKRGSMVQTSTHTFDRGRWRHFWPLFVMALFVTSAEAQPPITLHGDEAEEVIPEPVKVYEPASSKNAKPASPGQLGGKLKRIIDGAKFPKGSLGLWVGLATDASADAPAVFELASDQKMIPASVTKIATAAAALELLPPGYKIPTRLMSSAAIEGDRLRGDLYLVGGGDPTFVSENLWFLVNEFLRTGVRHIEGSLIVDDTLFDQERYAEDRPGVRVDRAYDAPMGAMSFNWNSVTVWVRPADQAGQAARVHMDFESDYVKLVNQSKTVAGRGNDIAVSRRTQNGIEVVTVSGTIGREAPEKPYYKSITRPDLWAGHSAVQFLASRGVQLKGQVRSGKLPTSARPMAVAESRPIAQIIADMMKWSSNFSAETISRLIAVHRGKTSVTAEDGRLAVVNWLTQDVGLPSSSFKLVNVAGFNRGNEFRARDLGKILSYAQTHFQIYPEFLTSMPVAGVDGTLRSRFKTLPGAGWVRAKTGLLDGVVGLSGYAGTRSGQIYRFVFVFNGPAGRGEDARQLFDRLASALVSDG